jgi:hypothetical protein
LKLLASNGTLSAPFSFYFALRRKTVISREGKNWAKMTTNLQLTHDFFLFFSNALPSEATLFYVILRDPRDEPRLLET